MRKLIRYAVDLTALTAAGLIGLAVASLAALWAVPGAAQTQPPAQRQAELQNLLTQDCGSCHGLTLAGGLGPSLQAADLTDKPSEYLAAAILYGRPGTAMPPWRPFLSDQDAAFLVQLLRQQTQ